MTRILGIGNIAKLPKMVESFKFCEKKWIGSLFSSVKQMKNYANQLFKYISPVFCFSKVLKYDYLQESFFSMYKSTRMSSLIVRRYGQT